MNEFFGAAALVTCIKFLLIESYHSTDFEVHRNWLAITNKTPLHKWYTEDTSKWTLDYPPLFAWFEHGLSYFASYFDRNMLNIQSRPYYSPSAVLFQRFTVILTDLFYMHGAYRWCRICMQTKRMKKFTTRDPWFNPKLILSILFLWNPGLLIVDHIHFQYNGFLSGILLLSMARMVEKKEIESAFWFSILLNLKHIYLCLAPIYFVYLLRNYCFDSRSEFQSERFIKLSLVVCSVFLFSFGPFLLAGQLTQIMSRLFPFGRGLTHAYWAPNFWALYNTVDKAGSIIRGSRNASAQMTGGLVQTYSHQFLPSITPFISMMFVIISMMPILHRIWVKHHQAGSSVLFVRSIILAAFSYFIFGYHVHEKAVLTILIPMTALTILTETDAEIFALASTIGTFSLFPLLPHSGETPTKILITLLYSFYTFSALKSFFKGENVSSLKLFTKFEFIYLLALIQLQYYYSFGYIFLPFIENRFPFLKLMLISFTCALGMIYCFVKFYKYSLNL